MRAVIFEQFIALFEHLGLFKSQFHGQSSHFFAQIIHDLAGLAAQNLLDIVDMAAIFFGRNSAFAAAFATLDVILKAHPTRLSRQILVGDRQAARAHFVELANQFQNCSSHRNIGVRAIVFRAVAHVLTSEKHPRIKFVGHHNPRIGFIVFEQHIISRLVLLDHGVFKVERILLGRHHDIAHIGDVAHQHVGAQHIVGAIEIRRHSSLQIFGLAHIYHRSLGIIVDIHAGGIGQKGDLFAQCFRFILQCHSYCFLAKFPTVGACAIVGNFGCDEGPRRINARALSGLFLRY